MAERFKAAVLKTAERKLRGFESLSLRKLKTGSIKPDGYRAAACLASNAESNPA